MNKKGLSLTELIVVIVIIGILAPLGFVQYGRVTENARSAEAYSVLADIVAGEKAYSVDNNDSYTTDITALHNFTTVPTSDNFTFSVPSADSNSGYAQAARVAATSARKSYGMCLKSGKRASCSADTCNPSCP